MNIAKSFFQGKSNKSQNYHQYNHNINSNILKINDKYEGIAFGKENDIVSHTETVSECFNTETISSISLINFADILNNSCKKIANDYLTIEDIIYNLVPEYLPVLGNFNRLQQAMDILLSNAFSDDRQNNDDYMKAAIVVWVDNNQLMLTIRNNYIVQYNALEPALHTDEVSNIRIVKNNKYALAYAGIVLQEHGGIIFLENTIDNQKIFYIQIPLHLLN